MGVICIASIKQKPQQNMLLQQAVVNSEFTTVKYYYFYYFSRTKLRYMAGITFFFLLFQLREGSFPQKNIWNYSMKCPSQNICQLFIMVLFHRQKTFLQNSECVHPIKNPKFSILQFRKTGFVMRPHSMRIVPIRLFLSKQAHTTFPIIIFCDRIFQLQFQFSCHIFQFFM